MPFFDIIIDLVAVALQEVFVETIRYTMILATVLVHCISSLFCHPMYQYGITLFYTLLVPYTQYYHYGWLYNTSLRM